MTATTQITDVLKPTGYRILVRMRKTDEKTRDGLLYVPQSTKMMEDTASQMGEVLAMGESAYMDSEKFPTGPWCKVGDTILMRSYAGSRFSIDKEEYRIINDDTVEGVALDPSRIERAV